MRVAMILLLVACSSPDKKPVQPTNHSEPTGSAAPTPPPSADDRVEKAEREAAMARKEAQEAMERVDRLATDLEALDKRVTDAIDAVVAAQSDADRANAKAKLEKLRREKAEMEQRIKDAREHAGKATRRQGRQVSKQCMDNPLAKGCD